MPETPLNQLIGLMVTGLTKDGKALKLGASPGQHQHTLTWDADNFDDESGPNINPRLYAYPAREPHNE